MQTSQRLTRKHKLLTTPVAFLRGSACDSWKQGCMRDADKWWDVVVMSRERCIAEAHRQLIVTRMCTDRYLPIALSLFTRYYVPLT